jgi:hypothetical protein
MGQPFAALTTIDAMTLATSLFLISTFAAVGLGALVASLAPGHWFLRMLAFLATLALLLRIPALEPFVALVIEGATVAAGAWLWRRAEARRTANRADSAPSAPGDPNGAMPQPAPTRRGIQFRLSTVLCAMALCGIASAIAARWPDEQLISWSGMISAGVPSGLATLLGAWAASRRWWWALPALAAALLLCIAPAWTDGFVNALTMFEWSLDASDSSSVFAAWLEEMELEGSWFLVIPAVTLSAFILVRVVGVVARPKTRRGSQHAACLLAVALAVVLALPPSYVLILMLTPPPIPQVTLPQPNGHDELVAAGRLAEKTLANTANFDPDSAKLSELEQAAQEAEPAFALARTALERECVAPVDYTIDSIRTDSFQQFRCLARAIGATGKFHAARGEMDEALAAYLVIVQAGVQIARGGLLIDGLVGCAVTGIGKSGVYHQIDKLSPSQCRATIARLQESRLEFEPFQHFLSRDRIWVAHVYGWVGLANQVLDDLDGHYYLEEDEYAAPFKREQAFTDLLVAELALRVFAVEQQRTPEAWDEVVAAGGPALAADPFDPAGGTLRFITTDAGPVVYSVGRNGIDDSGHSLNSNDPNWDPEEGDLRLDMMWAAEPGQGAAAAATAGPTASPDAEGGSEVADGASDADAGP